MKNSGSLRIHPFEKEKEICVCNTRYSPGRAGNVSLSKHTLNITKRSVNAVNAPVIYQNTPLLHETKYIQTKTWQTHFRRN